MRVVEKRNFSLMHLGDRVYRENHRKAGGEVCRTEL